MTNNALESNSLSKSIGNQYLIQDLTFSIPKGQKVLLLGHNGAGKSTLLKILAGLLHTTEGTLSINEQKAVYQGHELALYDELTVEENLSFFFDNDTQLKNKALEIWNLKTCRQRVIGNCSKGEKQRAALACSLFQPAGLFLLDEPTTGLDKESVDTLTGAIAEKKEQTVIIASHDFTSFSQIADRLIILRSGQIVHDSLLEQVPAVERAQHTSIVYLEYRV